MAPAIRRSIFEVGAANVHLVLMSTGEGSGARAAWALGIRPVGAPAFITHTLSLAQFSQARDREFRASAAALNVPARNVHLSLPSWRRVRESYSDEQASTFINAAIDRFGVQAAYWTMSDVDPSVDHSRLGAALRREGTRRGVARMTFCYPPYQLPAKIRLTRLPARTLADRRQIRAAASEYGVVNPAAGRFAVGWVSVPSAFGGKALEFTRAGRSGARKGRKVSPPKTALFDSQVAYIHR